MIEKIYASQDYVSEALANKISYNEQTLTSEQQEQVRKNIGALSSNITINGKELTTNTTLIANDFGVYVQSEEPTDAIDGDIWVDVDAKSHLDPEIVIDSTLTKSGQAADAKVVGDAIAAIPTVTSSDNGKFLRVSAEGKWVAQTVLNAEEVAF